MRRGCGTLTYRRNRKKSRKAPVVREVQATRSRQLFLVFLFVVSQFFFLQSSMFVVKDVSVKGTKGIPEASIRKAMDLSDGTRYWEVSPESLKADILELNGVESAKVDLIFPGTVQVRVAQRKPVFTLASMARSKHLFTVDKDGVILGQGEGPKGSLKLLLERPIKVGGLLSADELEVSNFLRHHLSDTLVERLDSVRFDSRGEVTLRMKYRDGKIPVRLGAPEKLTYKLFLLEELLASLKSENAQVLSVDLRFSTPIVRQPYTRPAVDPAAAPAE